MDNDNKEYCLNLIDRCEKLLVEIEKLKKEAIEMGDEVYDYPELAESLMLKSAELKRVKTILFGVSFLEQCPFDFQTKTPIKQFGELTLFIRRVVNAIRDDENE